MPIGIQRINAKKSQPNDRIVFIKPLKGPDEEIARDFLERIAAQCVPIMKEHYISVMSLEEYEPNREFVGRNFNAGEVVQLVLKSHSGRWLPFDYVQMVMMHELAHCKQMNHSRAFWAVRNQYAEQMRALWARKYTGEGLWGRGALLSTGKWEENTVAPGESLPEHLCGGTYRSRGRKRKAKQTLSWKEQKERRILKKFGANGVALGEDATAKQKLEKGRKTAAKPRVAGSARGRELRAAAALARFDQAKKEDEELLKVEDDEDGSEDDYEEVDDTQAGPDAVDINGTKLLDGKGRGMIKVCEDENPDDQDAQQELRELQSFGSRRKPVELSPPPAPLAGPKAAKASGTASVENRAAEKKPPPPLSNNASKAFDIASIGIRPAEKKKDTSVKKENTTTHVDLTTLPPAPKSNSPTTPRSCPICSFSNEQLFATCTMCNNVLDTKREPNSWKCTSSSCQGSEYRNASSSSVCGVCGSRKPLK